MNWFVCGLSLVVMMFALVSCGSLTSSDSDDNNRDIPTNMAGHFPFDGDSDFSCVITNGRELDGTRWVQYRLNIPNYKGMMERISINISGIGTQYYEQTYFNANPFEMNAMCLEFNKGIAEKEKRGHIFVDHQCDNGVSFFVSEFDGKRWITSEDEEDPVASRDDYYRELCEEYEKKWKKE